MFISKSEAYTYSIHLLRTAFPQVNPNVQSAIGHITELMENHEQDITKLISTLNELKVAFPDQKVQLDKVIDEINATPFEELPDEHRFANPLARQYESLIAIKMLNSPTPRTLAAVQTISNRIADILENYDELNEDDREVIDSFLKTIQHFSKDLAKYNSIITLGATKEIPTRQQVINLLRDLSPENFKTIMHIHYRFARNAMRPLPLSSAENREPVGKFKEVIERGYGSYDTFHRLISTDDTADGLTARNFISTTLIYNSMLYRVVEAKGALHFDEDHTTQQLGLMLDKQPSYLGEDAHVDHAWVSDAKSTLPNYKVPYVRDLIDNDDVYVHGPSGMSTLFLGLMETLGNFPTIEEKHHYFAAAYAYTVGGGFHSPHEVISPAHYSLNLFPGYHVELANIERKTTATPPNRHVFFETMAQADPDFQELKDHATEAYFADFGKGHIELIHARQAIIDKAEENSAVQRTHLMKAGYSRRTIDILAQMQKNNNQGRTSKAVRSITLQTLVEFAVSDYDKWFKANAKTKLGVGLFHHHGDAGIKRAFALKDFTNDSDFNRSLRLLTAFFNNDLPDDKNNGLFNQARHHDHSFVSFLLNRLKQHPELIQEINKCSNGQSDLVLEKNVDYTQKPTAEARKAAFKFLKEMDVVANVDNRDQVTESIGPMPR